MKKEIYKKVGGYPYEVSNLDNVRSIKTGRILRQEVDVWGYSRVCLRNGLIKKHLKVHRLIALSFIKNTQNKREVNHKDGNKLNNSISNLEWCTRSENMIHVFRVNKSPTMRGEKNGHAVLTASDVAEIKKLRQTGMYQYEIAKLFGIARTTVNAIVNGYNWKHVTI